MAGRKGRRNNKFREGGREEGAVQENTEFCQPMHTKNLRRKSHINYSDTAKSGKTVTLKYGIHNATKVESILNSQPATIKVEEMTDPSQGAFAGTRSRTGTPSIFPRHHDNLGTSRSQSPLKSAPPANIPRKKIFLRLPGAAPLNRDNSTPLAELGINSLPESHTRPKPALKRGRENDDEGESVHRRRKKVRLHSTPDIIPVSILPTLHLPAMYDYRSHSYHPVPSCRSPSLS